MVAQPDPSLPARGDLANARCSSVRCGRYGSGPQTRSRTRAPDPRRGGSQRRDHPDSSARPVKPDARSHRPRRRKRRRRSTTRRPVRSVPGRDHGHLLDARHRGGARPRHPARVVPGRAGGRQGRPPDRRSALAHLFPPPPSAGIRRTLDGGSPDLRRTATGPRRVPVRVRQAVADPSLSIMPARPTSPLSAAAYQDIQPAEPSRAQRSPGRQVLDAGAVKHSRADGRTPLACTSSPR